MMELKEQPDFIRLSKPFFDKTESRNIQIPLNSGWLTQGNWVIEFEKMIEEVTGTPAVAVSSGTAALHILMMILSVDKDSMVFVPSFAWPSAANISVLLGADICFVDAFPYNGNMCPNDLKLKLNEFKGRKRKNFIIPAHMFGTPCNMKKINKLSEEYDCCVIEDAACCFGSFNDPHTSTKKYSDTYHIGTGRNNSILSFHPRKNITTGEGGVILCSNEKLRVMCKQMRNHGQFERSGLNYRMGEINAAIGVGQIEKYPIIKKRRKEQMNIYMENLHWVFPYNVIANKNLFHQSLIVDLPHDSDRDSFISYMLSKNIEIGISSHAAHLMYAFSDLHKNKRNCPYAEGMNQHTVAIPLYHELRDSEIIRVCYEMMRYKDELKK